MSEVYHPLTENEAVAYAKKIPGLFENGSELICREIGDGNLNLVFHIQEEQSGKSLILKQALPYAKVVGESWPLTLDRARIESEALKLEGSLVPDLVPKVYDSNEQLALTVMEDLSDHVIMRSGLMQGNKYPLFAANISEFLAHTLFFTSDLAMNQQEKKAAVQRFINPELCKITEDLIFDHPYTDADTNHFNPAIKDEVTAIWQDRELHLEVAKLREKFLVSAQALLHGDLHTGSIFVTETSTKVIDPEFAFYGPMGFDIGAVLANLLLNYAAQEGWSTDQTTKQAFRDYLLQTIREIWASFESTFLRLWDQHGKDRMLQTKAFQQYYMQRLLQDATGYAGCKMIRRVVGLAHVADLDKIENPEQREKAERIALSIGRQLIKNHSGAQSIEQMLEIARASA